jgi:hypothetical protein
MKYRTVNGKIRHACKPVGPAALSGRVGDVSCDHCGYIKCACFVGSTADEIARRLADETAQSCLNYGAWCSGPYIEWRVLDRGYECRDYTGQRVWNLGPGPIKVRIK